jgi:two-component system, cell cycle sensor histidine kinase and response regulator CckA
MAERTLRESVEIQRSVFEALGDGIAVQDLDGRVVTANPAARRILGLELDEITGRTSADPRWAATLEDGSALPGEQHPAMVTLATGHPVRDFTMSLSHPDGRRIWIRVNAEPLRDPSGAVTGVATSFTDITAERDLEARLRQAQRLEAVGQLAGGIAHDFNNLLAAISGYGELAKDSLPLDSPARSDIDEVLRAAERAAGLTRQLLAFSRRQALRPEVVDPRSVVEHMTPMLGRLLGEHIALATTAAADLGHVRVDPGQLEQVILNLALNARDAMPDGGRLSIVLENVDLDGVDTNGVPVSPSGPCVRISVADTGSGMDPETLARAFEPFFTTKGPGGGSGMGLATVYGIVEQSAGRIGAVSEPGHGTTISVDLPRSPEPIAGGEGSSAVGAAPRGTETILLVEDEHAVRTAVARMLRGLGYAVREAGSAEDGLAIGTGADPVDLLVSDIQMPGLQGPELARRIRAVRPDLSVLFISGYAGDLPAPGAVTGARVLGKPFDAAALGRAAREVLDRQS